MYYGNKKQFMLDIIEKIKKSGLRGRSGSGFLTGLKWEMVKNAPGTKKYVICNAAEGDPNIFKDGFILRNYPEEVIKGIEIALKVIKSKESYIYLRKDYFQKYKQLLEKIIKRRKLSTKLFKKPGGYISGEETVLIRAIEGKSLEPRKKPPYPTTDGLFNLPTLINNIETFYFVPQIVDGRYKKTRFYSLGGEIKNSGVYELSEDLTIETILKMTGNWPRFKFFVQVGGTTGEILLENELKQKTRGLGGIIVYSFNKTDPFILMNKWIDFFRQENCDKCMSCREGVYRLKEILTPSKFDNKIFNDLVFILEKTSFCPLGKNISLPFKSLIKKIING
jgi:NADH:ubiquinone oxidoreductase subunit F (NADH-binding)